MKIDKIMALAISLTLVFATIVVVTADDFEPMGTEEFTLLDTDYVDGNYYSVYHDGTYVYTQCGNSGLRAYSFNENATEEFWLKDTDRQDTYKYQGISGDGTYIFAGKQQRGLLAYTFDGSNLTYINETTTGGSTQVVYWDGSYIFTAAMDYSGSGKGLYAYSFDGTSFTELACENSRVYNSVWSDETYVYAASTTSDGLYVFSFNGTGFTQLDSDEGVADYYGVYGDGTYIYTADGFSTSGIHAYSFNGSNLTHITNSSDAVFLSVYCSGEYIFASSSSSGIFAYTFNGTAFTLLDSDANVSWMSCGDGTYLYTAGNTNGVNAYSGFDLPTTGSISSFYPADGATNVDHQYCFDTYNDTTYVGVTVEHADGTSMDVTFATNATGSWENRYTYTGVGNGTYSWEFTDVDTAGKQYWWRVYVDDGGTNISSTYSFTTAGPTNLQVLNTADSTDFIDVKKGTVVNLSLYVDTNEMWIDAIETWQILYTAGLLVGVPYNGNATLLGDLFDDIKFEMTGVYDDVQGFLNETVYADGETNTSGTLFYFQLDTNQTGNATVKINPAEAGVAFTDDNDPWYTDPANHTQPTTHDRPFTVANLSLFIHYYIPTEPSAFTATTVHAERIDLSWTKDTTGNYGVNPDDGVGEYVYIERSTSSDPWARLSGSFVYNGTDSSYSDTDIIQGTPYYYQAWSYNVTDGLYSLDYSTAGNTTTGINPPGDVVVTPDDGVKMDLSWTTGLNGDKTYIERRTTPGPWNVSEGTPVYNDTGTSFKDDNLDHNTTYYYQLWSWNNDAGVYSDTFSSGSNTTSVLLAPTSLAAEWNDPNKHTQIDLTWTNADGIDKTYIERNTSAVWDRGTGIEIYNSTGTSYTDTGLLQNTQYYYRAWSWNETEGYSITFDSADNTTDDFLPPSVLIVETVLNDGTKMDLSWSGIDADADYVYIERSETPDWTRGAGDEVCNLTVGTTEFTDENLNHNTLYYYQAWGYNATQNIYSDLNTSESNTTQELLPPTVFTVVRNTAKPHTELDVSWTKAAGTDNTYVERYTSEGPWARGTGTIEYNGTDSSFTDEGLDQNTQYFYQAWSWNATQGFSNLNVSDNETTDDFLPPDPFTATANANVSITLGFTPEADSDYTIIERYTSEGPWARGTGSQIYNGTGTSYVDAWSNLDFDTTYYYQAWAYNVTQNIYSDLNSSANDTTVEFNAPTSLAVVWNASARQTIQDLTWANADINADATVIEYMEGAGASWSVGDGDEIYNGSAFAYSHIDLTQNTLYRYQAWSWNESRGEYSPLFDSADNTTRHLLSPSPFTAESHNWSVINLSWTIVDSDSDTTYIERNPTVEAQRYFQFNSQSGSSPTWTNPNNAVDTSETTYANRGVTSLAYIYGNANNCTGTDYGEISSVSIRMKVRADDTEEKSIQPVFGGTTEGSTYYFWYQAGVNVPSTSTWSSWADVTNDANAPTTWTWDDIVDLDCKFQGHIIGSSGMYYIYDQEIRVNYTYKIESEEWTFGQGDVVYNGTGTLFDDTGLNSKTTYYYKAYAYNASQNIYSALYSSANDTTLNTPPLAPTNIYPADNAPYCSVYPMYKVYIHDIGNNQTATSNLTVYVEDPDGDILDIHFYWDDGEYINTVSGVASGTNAVLNLEGNISADKSPTASAYDWFKHNTLYEWYAIANDTAVNTGDGHTTQGDVSDFTTSMATDINEDGTINYLDVSNLVSNYRETGDPGEDGWDINNDGIANYLDVSGLVSAYGSTYHTW